MPTESDSNHQRNLDDILKELEEQFGVHEKEDSKIQKKPSRSRFQKFSQNQIIGSVTLVLLIAGAVVGAFLGQQKQDLRQQAAPAYARKCTNTGGACGNEQFDTDPCFDNEGFEGVCDNDFSDVGTCTCIWKDVCCHKPDGTFITTTGPSCKHEFFGSQVDEAACHAEKCVDYPPTATACYGNTVGSRCTGFNGTCTKTTEVDPGKVQCACVADVAATATPAITAVPTQPPVDPTSPPQNTGAPEITQAILPTNTSVPTTPGQATNTPIPAATNTSVPLATLTYTPTATRAIIALNTQNTATPQPTNTSIPAPTATNLPAATATASSIPNNSSPQLPHAGFDNQRVFLIATVIVVATIIGVVLLLLIL